MRVLLVKLSSMGDVLHTLPALSDLQSVLPDVEVDWVIEPGFKEIARWHPAVKNIIPCALRTWRKSPLKALWQGEIQSCWRALRAHHYDIIIDAQGLVKSGIMACIAHGPRYGYDKASCRERCASYFYQYHQPVRKDQHAVNRMRQLFAQVFNYQINSVPQYPQVIHQLPANPIALSSSYVLFCHGTTWVTKHWPEDYWQQLIRLSQEATLNVVLPWGNAVEKARAERLKANAADPSRIHILPKVSLPQLARVLLEAKVVVAGDTGLAHMAAALSVPCVSLYGPNDPVRSGALGKSQIHINAQLDCAPCLGKTCAIKAKGIPPCMQSILPEQVWQRCMELIQ